MCYFSGLSKTQVIWEKWHSEWTEGNPSTFKTNTEARYGVMWGPVIRCHVGSCLQRRLKQGAEHVQSLRPARTTEWGPVSKHRIQFRFFREFSPDPTPPSEHIPPWACFSFAALGSWTCTGFRKYFLMLPVHLTLSVTGQGPCTPVLGCVPSPTQC